MSAKRSAVRGMAIRLAAIAGLAGGWGQGCDFGQGNAGGGGGGGGGLPAPTDWVLFKAMDAAGGTELWRSDGTVGGTFRVADIVPGIYASAPNYLTKVGHEVYFEAVDRNLDFEL